MRTQSSLTAKQLHSVAQRYRRAATGRNLENERRGNPNLGGFYTGSTEDGEEVVDFRIQRLEAILLLAREPLSIRKISQYASLADGTEARTLIQRLNEEYDETGRSFRVQRVAGGYQFLTRAKFASWVRSLESTQTPVRFSAPAMETLAVVAYRQPVLRADIEAIRGVGCGEILRQLMERDLVRIGGRSDELGRPYLYTTTQTFLQLFGLINLEELPRVETFREASPNDILGEDSEESKPSSQDDSDSADSIDQENEEESEVSVKTADELFAKDERRPMNQPATLESPRAMDDDEYDDDEEEDGEYDDDDEKEDEFDDKEPSGDEAYEDNEDNDDEDDDSEDDDSDDEGFEDDEWQEVDDDDDSDDNDNDNEEEWDDEDDVVKDDDEDEEEWD